MSSTSTTNTASHLGTGEIQIPAHVVDVLTVEVADDAVGDGDSGNQVSVHARTKHLKAEVTHHGG